MVIKASPSKKNSVMLNISSKCRCDPKYEAKTVRSASQSEITINKSLRALEMSLQVWKNNGIFN